MKNEQNQAKMSNFLAFDNNFFDLLQLKLTGNEFMLFTRIYKETIGWRREEHYISNTLLESKINLSINTIRDLLEKLVDYKMIFIKQVGKLKNIQQFIRINVDVNQYVFPEPKEKITSKVKNFFAKKTEAKKETYKANKKIEITVTEENQTEEKLTQFSETDNSNFGDSTAQNSDTNNAKFGGIIKTLKNNVKKHTYKQEQKKETPDMNDFKNLNSKTNKRKLDINSLDENKKTKANILIDFGINDYHPRFIDFLDLEENYIIDLIENINSKSNINNPKAYLVNCLIATLDEIKLNNETPNNEESQPAKTQDKNNNKKSSQAEKLSNYFKIFDIHQKLSEKYNFLQLQKLTGQTGKNQTELDLSNDIFRKITLIQDAIKDDIQNDSYITRTKTALNEFFQQAKEMIGFDNLIDFLKDTLGFRKENNRSNLDFIINTYRT